MRLCDETITVFNKKLDEETGFDTYIPTVIRGVSWYCEIASTVDTSGLKAANKFTIRIPEDADFSDKEYVNPADYVGGNVEKVFTLGNGDIIVRGAVTEPGLKPAELQARFGEIVTVLGVTNDRRTRNAPHWKVVGA